MQPRSIGIIAGGGGPLGSSAILRDIIFECQKSYGSWRSYEYPAINFFAHPYSEMMLTSNADSIPSRELSYSIQQLKLVGMEIVVVPCFTMSSYLTYRNYGIELIEMGPIVQSFLQEQEISNPLVLCSERTRKSQYCDKFFKCQYPSEEIQQQIQLLGEDALKGKTVDITPILSQIPSDTPIVCAFTVLNAQKADSLDKRWINPNILLAKYVVKRSFLGLTAEIYPLKEKNKGYLSVQREMIAVGA